MITWYRDLLNEQDRIEQFQKAVHQVVKPGDVVVEVGAGLGTYSFFAAQAGAKQVYAIEKGNIVHLATQIAQRNGLDGLVTFIKANSLKAELPELADVLIFEDFDPFLSRWNLSQILLDAIKRFLKPDGLVMPRSLWLNIAPFESERFYRHLDLWQEANYHRYGLDWSLIRPLLMNKTHLPFFTNKKSRGKSIATPQEIHRCDFRDADQYTVERSVTFTIQENGTVHGLLGWFCAELAEGIIIDNSPSAGLPSWGQMFFPIDQPISVRRGDQLWVRIFSAKDETAKRIWWTWQVAANGEVYEGSTFNSIPLSIQR